jgi:hypothetical protein
MALAILENVNNKKQPKRLPYKEQILSRHPAKRMQGRQEHRPVADLKPWTGWHPHPSEFSHRMTVAQGVSR